MNQKNAIILGLIISVIAEVFLVYLVYFNQFKIEPVMDLSKQVWLNALFNSLSAISLFFAMLAIKKKQVKKHVLSIHLALAFSALFLINYILYHSSAGHVPFEGESYRILYFSVLITHLVASFISLPLVFISYLLGVFGHVYAHKKIAFKTFLLWEYVSITGVLIVLIRKFLN